MSNEQLLESGVEQGGVNGMGVIEQEQMLAVLVEGESEVLIDDELIALLGIEIVMVPLPVERTKRSEPDPPIRVSSPEPPRRL